MHKVLAEISHLLGVPLTELRKSRGSCHFYSVLRDGVGHCCDNSVQSTGLTGSLKTGSGVMTAQESGVETGSTHPDRQTFSCL